VSVYLCACACVRTWMDRWMDGMSYLSLSSLPYCLVSTSLHSLEMYEMEKMMLSSRD
jgi:hypothetical protein